MNLLGRRRRARVTGVGRASMDVEQIVAASITIGPADGEVRPEALEPGDAVRWLRRWHDVTRVQRTGWGTYLWLVEHDTDVARVVMYRPGVWVAARACRRDELPSETVPC